MKEILPIKSLSWLVQNDDFDYKEIDGVDVPTYESIAKVMDKYTEALESRIKELEDRAEVAEQMYIECHMNGAFLSTVTDEFEERHCDYLDELLTQEKWAIRTPLKN